jgi:hypothetical protein
LVREEFDLLTGYVVIDDQKVSVNHAFDRGEPED